MRITVVFLLSFGLFAWSSYGFEECYEDPVLGEVCEEILENENDPDDLYSLDLECADLEMTVTLYLSVDRQDTEMEIYLSIDKEETLALNGIYDWKMTEAQGHPVSEWRKGYSKVTSSPGEKPAEYEVSFLEGTKSSFERRFGKPGDHLLESGVESRLKLIPYQNGFPIGELTLGDQSFRMLCSEI